MVSVLLGGLTTSLLAEPIEKTTVQIAIDSGFNNKNIVFKINNPLTSEPESIGAYQAGKPLFIKQKVNSVLDPNEKPIPCQVTAYVSDTETSITKPYYSVEKYTFDKDGFVQLSFSSMFSQQLQLNKN